MRTTTPQPTRSALRIACALGSLLLGVVATTTVNAVPAGACTPLPWPQWDDLRAAEAAPPDSPAGEITSVVKRVHRADDGHGTASVSVAVRHWGPNAPTGPVEATLHDDTDLDHEVDMCAFPTARTEGTVEYLAHTDSFGSIEIHGRADEATLTRLFGEPTDLEVDETDLATTIDELPDGSTPWAKIAAAAAGVAIVAAAIVVGIVALRRRRPVPAQR